MSISESGVTTGPETFRMYVDGRWCGAAGDRTYPVVNPATEEVIATVPDASDSDMQNAIAAARRAFDDGPWARTTPHDRARVLRRLVDALEKRKESLRRWLVSCAGAEYLTHWAQLDTPIAMLGNYAELATSFRFEEILPVVAATSPLPQLSNSMAYHQPVGVCGMIPTWNFPLYISAQKIGPALATGCTMVFKPSPYVPILDLLLAEAVEECDLPPGVFNVVTGESPALGAALVESPLVDKISYTGSVATGKRILAAAAATLKRVHLELGGKSAAIVLDDADLDTVAPLTSGPSFFHAGQGCAMCTRVLVPKAKHDGLVDRVTNFLQALVRVGNPADPGVILGPVIRAERRAQIESYIASGNSDGARLAAGGGRPAHLPKGYFLEPTVFANVRNDMKIAREEIFGPVLSVLPFEDEEDAIRIANQSAFGLGGAIFSPDLPKALAMAKRIRTGTLNINGAVSLVHTPFGGFKESGIGREGGRWGMMEYSEVQAIAWK